MKVGSYARIAKIPGASTLSSSATTINSQMDARMDPTKETVKVYTHSHPLGTYFILKAADSIEVIH